MAERRTVYVLNGANLNLLGTREPEIYGAGTLAELERSCRAEAEALGLDLIFHQTNAEHELVEWVQEARDSAGLVLNPAAFGYSSYALVDALLACACPIIEVHLTNIQARTPDWRAHTLTGPVVSATISGLGFDSYCAALRFLAAAPARPRPT